MSRRVIRSRLAAATLLFCGAQLACRDRAASADGPYAELVAKYVPRIEETVGLTFKTPPKVERKTKAEVAVFVRRQLESARGRELVEGQQSVYRLLGMIPDTMNLSALLQKLLEEQIVGFYDPASKVLYVVDGAPSALLEQTVSHELVHALQDQYVRIDSIQEETSVADRQLAAQSVLEGQAVYVQLRVDANAGPMLKMPGGWDRIRDMIRDGSVGMPVFAAAPRSVREGLLFPYLGGADFVRRFVTQRPEKELLTDLPISSRQILSDAAYFTDTAQRVKPVDVTLPAPKSGTVTFSNGFGEFETRLALGQYQRNEEDVRRAAGGLAGDRYAVIRTAAGDALVWATVWDSPVDAADFLDLMGDTSRRRYDLGRQDPVPGATTRRYDVPAKGARGARTVTLAVEQVSGRPVVLYMDLPAGTPAPIDASRIIVGR